MSISCLYWLSHPNYYTKFVYMMKIIMTGFILRIIAMSTMLLDHIGWNFIDNPMLLTWIGRIAFPCYAFLLAEAFFFVFKEKRRLLKYVSTLILLAVISEPCYDLLEFGANIGSSFMEAQSVMITLLLGFLWMSLTELLFPTNEKKSERVQRKYIIVLACAYLLIGFTNYKMEANFNFVWPLLAIAFYRYIRYSRNEEKTENKWWWAKRFWVLVWIFAVYLPIYFWVKSWFGDGYALLGWVRNYFPWIGWHILAALILSFSNGKLWYHKKWFKIFYTLFYPVHALIIGLLIAL